jgi:hypothetical protein
MTWTPGRKTFTAGAALAEKRRVKIKAGTTTTPPEVEPSGAGEAWIGVTEYAVESGDPVEIRLKNVAGTIEVECNPASSIVRGTLLYGAADGRVAETSSGTAVGYALEPGVAGQQIEVVLT